MIGVLKGAMPFMADLSKRIDTHIEMDFSTRKAEPSYDLFAVAMVMIHCEYGDRFEKTKEPPLSLFEKKINQRDHLKIFKPVLLKALTGKYGRAIDMKRGCDRFNCWCCNRANFEFS